MPVLGDWFSWANFPYGMGALSQAGDFMILGLRAPCFPVFVGVPCLCTVTGRGPFFPTIPTFVVFFFFWVKAFCNLFPSSFPSLFFYPWNFTCMLRFFLSCALVFHTAPFLQLTAGSASSLSLFQYYTSFLPPVLAHIFFPPAPLSRFFLPSLFSA